MKWVRAGSPDCNRVFRSHTKGEPEQLNQNKSITKSTVYSRITSSSNVNLRCIYTETVCSNLIKLRVLTPPLWWDYNCRRVTKTAVLFSFQEKWKQLVRNQTNDNNNNNNTKLTKFIMLAKTVETKRINGVCSQVLFYVLLESTVCLAKMTGHVMRFDASPAATISTLAGWQNTIPQKSKLQKNNFECTCLWFWSPGLPSPEQCKNKQIEDST